MNLSASKLKTYAMCPKQYKYTYELGFIRKETTALLIGTRYHRLLNALHTGQELGEIKTQDKKILE